MKSNPVVGDELVPPESTSLDLNESKHNQLMYKQPPKTENEQEFIILRIIIESSLLLSPTTELH